MVSLHGRRRKFQSVIRNTKKPVQRKVLLQNTSTLTLASKTTTTTATTITTAATTTATAITTITTTTTTTTATVKTTIKRMIATYISRKWRVRNARRKTVTVNM